MQSRMIVDIHTHVFRPETDFGPRLRTDLARCGVDPASWGDVCRPSPGDHPPPLR